MDLSRGARVGIAMAAAVLIWATLTAAGTALQQLSGLLAWDEQRVLWFESIRTPELNFLTHLGSSLADTPTCIAVAAITVIVFRLWLKRWDEGVIVMAAIVGELLIFLAVTASIERARPEVEALDVAPPTSSFPSGHVGASVALYGSIAIVLLLVRPGNWGVTLIAVCLLFIPSIVALSRVYRGMHFPTDVFAGSLGGGAWLFVCITVIGGAALGRGASLMRVDSPLAR